MIQQIQKSQIAECVQVIRESFLTVANEFHFTKENASRFTAFAVSEDRLSWQLEHENRPMFAFFSNSKIVGYYSLSFPNQSVCELNNLCVLPAYRHNGIGQRLLEHARQQAMLRQCKKMQIGIVEENVVLKNWYQAKGFIHTGTKKFDFFPFTCGYLEMYF